MSYLLDTDICIFFLQGKFGLNMKLKEIGVKNCAISEITIAELKYGAFKSKNPKKHLAEIQKLETLFHIIPIGSTIDLYAEERLRLEKLGTKLPDFDLLIGTTSITHSMLMISNNEKHLSRLKGINLENWTKSKWNKYAS